MQQKTIRLYIWWILRKYLISNQSSSLNIDFFLYIIDNNKASFLSHLWGLSELHPSYEIVVTENSGNSSLIFIRQIMLHAEIPTVWMKFKIEQKFDK